MIFDKLSDICEVIDSLHKTPKYSDVGKPMVRCTDVKYGELNLANTFRVSDEVFAEFSKRYSPQIDDIIITRVGSYGITAQVKDTNFCLGQNTSAVKPKGINPDYLYLVLNSKIIKNQIEFSVVGSTQKTLSLKAINNLDIPRFGSDIEDKIASVGASLDDKVVNNIQTNRTLEEMAQAIFKSWFVDFDPVKAKMNGEQPEGMDEATASLFPEKLVESELGLIPEGWEVNQLSDICKNHSQSYNLKSVDEVVFVNTGDVQEGDFLHKNYSPVVGLPGQAKKAIKEDDILYSEIRPKNKRFAYVDFDVSDYVVSTKFMVIQANEKVHPRLLYMILTRQNTIDEFNIIADSRSGTFPQITFKAISNLEFCMAPREIQDAFVSQIMPMIKLQSSLKSENKQLAEMRDTLLPKLLSGEIDLETTIEN
ncbi:restriction endonuclease subunit S [Vibrio breoganii]|uniref:restriction endonuclease subunit S n=1 Tax=Vibrio breoganii TaxID=553239 RepID=UPI0010BD40B9|nr:restriction endonuclease subunit S [Vibrio breoganii]TKF90439.1 restriction endonuclease subunit S [Vibrio breoganii]